MKKKSVCLGLRTAREAKRGLNGGFVSRWHLFAPSAKSLVSSTLQQPFERRRSAEVRTSDGDGMRNAFRFAVFFCRIRKNRTSTIKRARGSDYSSVTPKSKCDQGLD
jgi:hypothetical protein